MESTHHSQRLLLRSLRELVAKRRGRRAKAERLMNRFLPVEMELGKLYIVKNPDTPNPFLVNQRGSSHIVF
jgi:hypothetical protein